MCFQKKTNSILENIDRIIYNDTNGCIKNIYKENIINILRKPTIKNKNSFFEKKIKLPEIDNHKIPHHSYIKSGNLQKEEIDNDGENIFIHLKYPSDAKIEGQINFQSEDLEQYFITSNCAETDYLSL